MTEPEALLALRDQAQEAAERRPERLLRAVRVAYLVAAAAAVAARSRPGQRPLAVREAAA